MVWGEEDVQPQIDEGNRLLEAGDLNGAYEAFQVACNRNPDVADAHFGLARVWFQRDEAHRARQCVGRALQLEPDHSAARQLMAQCDAALGTPAQAGAASGGFGDDDLFGSDDLGLGGSTGALDAADSSPARPARRRRTPLETMAWVGVFLFLGVLVLYGIWFAVDNLLGPGGFFAGRDEKPAIVAVGGATDSVTAPRPTPSAESITGMTGEVPAWSDDDFSKVWGEDSEDGFDNGRMSRSSGGLTDEFGADPFGTLLRELNVDEEASLPASLFSLFGLVLGLTFNIWVTVLAFQKNAIHGVLCLLCTCVCCFIYPLYYVFKEYQGDLKSILVLMWLGAIICNMISRFVF